MKIKHIFSIALAAAAMGSFSACTDYEGDGRYVPLEPEVPSVPEEPSTPDEPEDPNLIKPVPRVVFLEEFTGQKCLNCPTAHGIIANLKSGYGDRFVPVSIHYETPGDAFNFPPSPVSLVTEDGNYYASKWSIVDLPTGTVDMTSLSGMSEWTGLVRAALSGTSPIDIALSAENNGGTINVTAEVAAAESVKGTLVFWLVESGVQAIQLQPDGNYNPTYIHNHILRSAIGNRDGQSLDVAAQSRTEYKASIDITGKGYEADNLSVVAFVMTGSWRNVIQAAEFDFGSHE